MELEELNVYKISMEIADEVWDVVEHWDYFAKDTVGNQLIKSVDSIAANISEGYGRFHYKENKNFNYYARGSLYETKTWLTKSLRRKLIDNEKYQRLIQELESLAVKLNNYINSIGK
jgi:four helix bundle protein